MRLNRLNQLPANGVERIQRGQRILENRADFAATNLAQCLVRQVVNTFAVEQNLATGDATGWFQQPDDRSTSQGFASPRLSDHAQYFTRRNGERHVIDGREDTAPRRKFNAQVFDFKNRCGHVLINSDDQGQAGRAYA